MESFLTGGTGGRLRLFSVKLRLLEKRGSAGSERTEESYISDSKLSFDKLLLTFSGEDRPEEFVTRGSDDTEEDSEMPESRPLISVGVAEVSRHLNTSLTS